MRHMEKPLLSRAWLIKILSLMILTMQNSYALDLDKATDEGCKCMKLPYEKLEKLRVTMKDAMATGDMSKMMTLQSELMPTMNETATCFEKLGEKYPEIAMDDKMGKQAAAMMGKKCPPPDMGSKKSNR